jgi:hypothetical protein
MVSADAMVLCRFNLDPGATIPLTNGAGILDGVEPVNEVGVPGRAEVGDGNEDPGDKE